MVFDVNTSSKCTHFRINHLQEDYIPFDPQYDYGKSDFSSCISSPSLVPVIKIYATDEVHDQKCTFLVHNIYPYFYVSPPSRNDSVQANWRSEILSVGCLLERILGKNAVYKIMPVRGTSFYGYWDKEQVFLKILLFNSAQIKKAADFLVKVKQYAVYEVHIQFMLQFMIDFGLYGMDYIHMESYARDRKCNDLFHSWPQFIKNRTLIVEKESAMKREGRKGRLIGVFVNSLTDFLTNCNLDFTDTPTSPFKSPTTNPSSDKVNLFGSFFEWEKRFSSYEEQLMKVLELKSNEEYEIISRDIPSAFESVELSFSPLPNLIILANGNTQFDQTLRNDFIFSPIEITEIGLNENFDEIVTQYELQSQLEQVNAPELNEIMSNLWEDNGEDVEEESAEEETSENLLFVSIYNNLDGIYESQLPDESYETDIWITPAMLAPAISSSEFKNYPKISLGESIDSEYDSLFLTPLKAPPRMCHLQNLVHKNNAQSLLTPNRIHESQQEQLNPLVRDTLYNLRIFSIEVFAMGSDNLVSDPRSDAILCICYSIFKNSSISSGVCKICDGIKCKFPTSFSIHEFNTEPELIAGFLKIFDAVDADILIGFEVHKNSWGYLLDRIQMNYLELFGEDCLSRDKEWRKDFFKEGINSWNYKKTSSLVIPGRHVMNIWRVLRHEYNFTLHTFEWNYFLIFGKKIPHITLDKLRWFYSDALTQHRTISYVMKRAEGNLNFLIDTEILRRNVEFCKFFGIDFSQVYSRGSQFRVESLMLRIAKLESFLAFSPTKIQVANMNAAECLPMVLEPENNFYNSPVVVLDFQSLYPSMMIAYNICFSTCLGNLKNSHSHGKDAKNTQVGCGHRAPPHLVNAENVLITPNGSVFVRKEIREGILPKMLTEILQARIQVKKMLRKSVSKIEQKKLNAFQLGLKLIANVTYGYTSAAFSGRMPMVEVADAIVESGRMTLQRSIQFVNQHPTWNARVVYGDTDSLFVLLEGSSRERAFKIGNEIVTQITALNPRPVQLRFEKVYHPCILMAKKRYVGWKWEDTEQTEYKFDAKGIETVRRDSCPLVAKVMEKFLNILFSSEGSNVAECKEYLQKVWQRMRNDYYPVSDYIFTNEVKNLNKKSNSLATTIAKNSLEKDPNCAPQYGERVPYLVVIGLAKGDRLVDQVISPDSYSPEKHTIYYDYYIKKQMIPVLSRCLPMDKFNILSWYNESFCDNTGPTFSFKSASRIDSYFTPKECITCNSQITRMTRNPDEFSSKFCTNCYEGDELWRYHWYKRSIEDNYQKYQKICSECCNISCIEDIPCEEIECRIFWRRKKSELEYRAI